MVFESGPAIGQSRSAERMHKMLLERVRRSIHLRAWANALNHGSFVSIADLDHTIPVPAVTSHPINPNGRGD